MKRWYLRHRRRGKRGPGRQDRPQGKACGNHARLSPQGGTEAGGPRKIRRDARHRPLEARQVAQRRDWTCDPQWIERAVEPPSADPEGFRGWVSKQRSWQDYPYDVWRAVRQCQSLFDPAA